MLRLGVEDVTHVRGAPVFCALYKQGGDIRGTAWPLLWVQAVSSALLSDFHFADRHNIFQCSAKIFPCQLQPVVRLKTKTAFSNHAWQTVDFLMPHLSPGQFLFHSRQHTIDIRISTDEQPVSAVLSSSPCRFTFHQLGRHSCKWTGCSLTGEETSCFVLEVVTVVLAKTGDEGHFPQEQAPQSTELGVFEALFLLGFFLFFFLLYWLEISVNLCCERFHHSSTMHTCAILTLSKLNSMEVLWFCIGCVNQRGLNAVVIRRPGGYLQISR